MPRILQTPPPPPQTQPPPQPTQVVAQRPAEPPPQPAAVPKKQKGPIVFPEIRISGVTIPRANLKISVANAIKMLAYETEAQYKVRGTRDHGGQADLYCFRPPGLATDHKSFARLANSPEANFTDPSGELVCCWRNANNRPLDVVWVRELMQDMAERGWRLNCENIIISKRGMVMSGQHRLIALIWLWIVWRGEAKGDAWGDLRRLVARHWGTEEPYIESLVACGADDDVDTLMTLDNTKARSDADNGVQLELFEGWTRKVPQYVQERDANGRQVIQWVDAPLSAPQKRECSAMWARQVDTLWVRLGAGGVGDTKRSRSKKATLDFTLKHPTILDCVRHIWRENGGDGDKGKTLSDLLGSAGDCAAMMWLMAQCRTDGAAYRDRQSLADRDESRCDFSAMDKAKEFWSLLAASGEGGTAAAEQLFRPLRRALGLISDPSYGLGQRNGTPEERQGLVAKAWAAFLAHGGIEDGEVSLRYAVDVDQEGHQTDKWLDEMPKFGGADLGLPTRKKAVTTSATPPTQAEVAAAQQQAEQARTAEINRRAEAARANQSRTVKVNDAMRETVNNLKSQYPGKMLVFVAANGKMNVFGTDAEILSRSTAFPLDTSEDPCRLEVQRNDAQLFLGKVEASNPNAMLIKRETVPQGAAPRYSTAQATWAQWQQMVA